MRYPKTLNDAPKRVQIKIKKDLDMWELERIIHSLPLPELRQVYEIVDEILQDKFGQRMHL